MTPSRQSPVPTPADQYGQRVAAHLELGLQDVGYDISERLRAARTQALARRKVTSNQAAVAVFGRGGAASHGGWTPGRWQPLASALPLVVLLAALVSFSFVLLEDRMSDLAEVDAALLIDDLPPAAYADPGFLQFLQFGPPETAP